MRKLLCLWGFVGQQDTALSSTHLAMKDFKEHAFDGSFLRMGHVAPLTQNVNPEGRDARNVTNQSFAKRSTRIPRSREAAIPN